MGLLSKLKSVLGLGSDDDDRGGRRTDDIGVTVERERDEADAANEAVVKGVDESDEVESSELEAGTEAAAADDADSDGEPEPESELAGDDEHEADADTDVAAEADEATDADAEADEATDADEDIGADAAPEADAGAAEGSTADAGGDLQDIKGIGPAYGDRLAEVGIESIAELADADHEAVADEADLAPGRVEQWVGRANARQ
jgi:predicted flap endonuclease-1-like 5' DNA nuclease